MQADNEYFFGCADEEKKIVTTMYIIAVHLQDSIY